ncbi:MAG: ABC transporter permease [candidate division KSB1 bacterium]|nr:ABC transporter permease [candidate division KSB1 bacterium]
MKVPDLLKMSFGNLKRTKLRTFLTTSGVIIGIGALVSMVSFGTGMQKNFSDALAKIEVFTSLQVLPKKVTFEEMMRQEEPEGQTKIINDSTIAQIAALEGVKLVYPEIRFPAKVKLGDQEVTTTVQAMPAAMGEIKPYQEMDYGTFFQDDSAQEVVVSTEILRRLKVQKPDSALGQTLKLVTAKIDLSQFSQGLTHLDFAHPFAEEVTELKVVGIWKQSEFTRDFSRGVIVPLETSKSISRLNFSSVFELLRTFSAPEGYSSLQVRVARMQDVERIQKKIEAMGYGVWTIASELEEMRKGFLIFDAALGTVGTIALIVASLGIINTMVMSVLERYREIGIMKAIGATNGEIKRLFFFESSAIGFWGGIFGVILGWLVTRLANTIGNYYILKGGGSRLELFYIPWWLVLGGILFAIGVSLVAGLYPASRAAKVDPVKALRHE